MKIRSGFVSNSSSSSFILVGAEYPRDKYTRDDFVSAVGTTSDGPYAREDSQHGENQYRLVFADHEEFGAPVGKLWIGRRTDLDGYFGTDYVTLSEMEEVIDVVRDLFKNPDKTGVFMGRRST